MLLRQKEAMYANNETIAMVARAPFKGAEAVAIDLGLDTDQTNAFLLCARQTIEKELYRRNLTAEKPAQMILYLGGEGGTGKSAVLRALTTYMGSIGVRHQLRIASQTGVAAGNVGGNTLHLLLRLPTTKREKEANKALSETVITNFRDVSLFFIDEISMTGCGTVHTIPTRLMNAKSNDAEPFGGVDMIFAGDFYQLPPTGDDALYKKVNMTEDGSTVNTALAGLSCGIVVRWSFLSSDRRRGWS